jgi:hypothetical protein
MHRSPILGAAVVAVTLTGATAPTPALADTGAVPVALTYGVGILGLVIAIVLLVIMLALRRVAAGAAIAEYMVYVFAGVVTLTASVVAGWAARFLPAGVSLEQTRLASDLLVLASMVFFAIYFQRVYRALSRYVRMAEHSEDLLAQIHAEGALGSDAENAPAEAGSTSDSSAGNRSDG